MNITGHHKQVYRSGDIPELPVNPRGGVPSVTVENLGPLLVRPFRSHWSAVAPQCVTKGARLTLDFSSKARHVLHTGDVFPVESVSVLSFNCQGSFA